MQEVQEGKESTFKIDGLEYTFTGRWFKNTEGLDVYIVFVSDTETGESCANFTVGLSGLPENEEEARNCLTNCSWSMANQGE